MTSNWITSKRNAMRAILPTTSVRNDRRLSGSMLEQHSVIEKTTGRMIVQATINGTKSGYTACISVHPMYVQYSLYGYGRATGTAVQRTSAALQAAIASAGIGMVGGYGDRAMTDALLAIAYAAGARFVVII